MTKTRMGEAWMPADEYGRGLPEVYGEFAGAGCGGGDSLYRDVLAGDGAVCGCGFAAMEIGGTEFMLHADHAYDRHPLHERVHGVVVRGLERRFA